MKIVAGLGSLQDFHRYTEAGADELFCGCMPVEWLEKYGVILPLNRREVLLYSTQIGSMTDMHILARMAREEKVPVAVTVNSTHYTPEQYPVLLNMIRELTDMGFARFIIADPLLMLRVPPECGIHVSGEFGEFSTLTAQWLRKVSPKRLIFHRKVTPEEMRACREALPGIEYEAFILNERCYYTGAMCNSLHADEMPHICKLPYVIGGVSECIPHTEPKEFPFDGTIPGAGGCGICALPALREAGITHLKLVGRGNNPDRMTADIRFLKKALAADPCELPGMLFPGGCSGACYY